MQPTVSDLRGAQGPFLLEVKLTDFHRGQTYWRLVQSVGTAEEGLAVAARMSQAYSYRLFLGESWGYLYLDWQDDEGGETCSPVWRKP